GAERPDPPHGDPVALYRVWPEGSRRRRRNWPGRRDRQCGQRCAGAVRRRAQRDPDHAAAHSGGVGEEEAGRVMADALTLAGDVLLVGGGGAGMFAAIAAARNGASVLLVDKNVVGRGGATIMAQMTCASALGEVEPDSPEHHLADTLAAGRGLCDENLAALLCEGSPKRIRELADWKVNWARREDGRINQVKAPGHSRQRCAY